MSKFRQRNIREIPIPRAYYWRARKAIECLPQLESDLKQIEELSEIRIRPGNIEDKVDLAAEISDIYAALDYVPKRYQEAVLKHVAYQEYASKVAMEYEAEGKIGICERTVTYWSHIYVWGYICIKGWNYEWLKKGMGV